jgi:predicted Zn finger-like uncharacterized protein
MADEKFTRCPGCKTIFRVTAQQLEMRAGQVRCGHCRTVFDGVGALISLAPQPDQLAPATLDRTVHVGHQRPIHLRLDAEPVLERRPDDPSRLIGHLQRGGMVALDVAGRESLHEAMILAHRVPGSKDRRP